jgi:alpha-N-acetylglucosamine transferase
VLGRSLLKTRSKYYLLVIIPETMTELVKGITDENLIFTSRSHIGGDMKTAACDRYVHCLNKLHCWTLLEFDQVCWLDSDLVVLQNIDEILTTKLSKCRDQIAMASGCTCNGLRNPKFFTRPELCPFLHSNKIYGNAGVLLIRPSMSVYKTLLTLNYDYPLVEQDAFNIHFLKTNDIVVLDSKFNYLNHLPIVHPESKIKLLNADSRFNNIHVFHFGYGKPWDKNTLKINQEFYDYWNELALEL